MYIKLGGNHKLRKGHIAYFDLPAGQTCGRHCRGCYAIRSQQRFPAVLAFRRKALRFSETKKFVSTISAEIEALPAGTKAVRIHSSGDFYSQAYINKWVAIAKQNPGVLFYTYTKQTRRFVFKNLKRLKNVTVINSEFKNGPNFGNDDYVEKLKRRGMYVCPAMKPFAKRGKREPGWQTTGITCGNGCDYCLHKPAQYTGVAFYQH